MCWYPCKVTTTSQLISLLFICCCLRLKYILIVGNELWCAERCACNEPITFGGLVTVALCTVNIWYSYARPCIYTNSIFDNFQKPIKVLCIKARVSNGTLGFAYEIYCSGSLVWWLMRVSRSAKLLYTWPGYYCCRQVNHLGMLPTT